MQQAVYRCSQKNNILNYSIIITVPKLFFCITAVFKSLSRTVTCTRELSAFICVISRGADLISGATRTSRCTKGHRKQRRATPHEQPRGLECESRCKNS